MGGYMTAGELIRTLEAFEQNAPIMFMEPGNLNDVDWVTPKRLTVHRGAICLNGVDGETETEDASFPD